MSDDLHIYRIRRFYFDEGKPTRTIKARVTLEEAQAHCSKPETSNHTNGPGGWFDGYDLMPGYKHA